MTPPASQATTAISALLDAGITAGGSAGAEVLETLSAELEGVEARFAAELVSDLACVNALTSHIERYRGKMLRPMLVLLPGMAITQHIAGVQASSRTLTDAHRVLAAVVEMIHMATLVHDDVLDEAHTRRKGATVNNLRGNETAVMLGDYLISHAYHLCSSIDKPWVARTVAQTTNVVCEGELLQLSNRYNWELDEGTYFEIVRRKTASLCGVSCRLAAELLDAPREQVDALERYGESLGVAFQVVDDLLDLTGDPQRVGKTLGLDLAKGKLTLPLIRHLEEADAATRSAFIDLLSQAIPHSEQPEVTVSPEVSEKVRASLAASDSLPYARQWAERLIADARSQLTALPEGPVRDLLHGVAGAVISRRS